MKKIRQHNDIDISVILKNTEGEMLDPSLCKGFQILVQTNGNETQITKYDIFEDGHIVFRFNAKDQTQIGVYDIVISATTTDGRVFTTDVCKAFCIVPCTCCTDNEPGEVEIETLEVEATIEITSWGYMYDKRVEAIEASLEEHSGKFERLEARDDKLQEQIDSNHSYIATALDEIETEFKRDYSKKSNTLRHLTLSPLASANSLSLLLEGEYDDSVQGTHILGPDNIILPNATESKAGVMSPEDKRAIVENKNNIETLGLITAQGFQGVDESIERVRKETNASIEKVADDVADVKNDIETNTNNITLLSKNIRALASSTQEIIDGRTTVAKAKDATSAEKDSDGKIIKDTYAKQEDYNYTLGTALATNELGDYFNINHNYNKTLAIPYATESKAGVMSPGDKKAIQDNKNTIEALSFSTLQGFQNVDNNFASLQEQMRQINNALENVTDKMDVTNLFTLEGVVNATMETIAGNYLYIVKDNHCIPVDFNVKGNISPGGFVSNSYNEAYLSYLTIDNSNASIYEIRATIQAGSRVKCTKVETIIKGGGGGVMSLSGKLNLADKTAVQNAQKALTNTNEIAYYLITDNEGKIPSKVPCYRVPEDVATALGCSSPHTITQSALSLLNISLNGFGVNVGDLIALTRVKVKVSDLASAIGKDLSVLGNAEIEIYQYKILSTNDAKPYGYNGITEGVAGLMSPWDKEQVNKALLMPTFNVWDNNMNECFESGIYPWCLTGRPEGSAAGTHYTCVVEKSTTADTSGYYTIVQTCYGREGVDEGKIFKRIIFRKDDGTTNWGVGWKRIDDGALATKEDLEQAISNAITNTLNTPV